MRLGRRRHDPVAYAQVPAHRFGIALPPARLDRRAWNFNPGMYHNDVYSDCTSVAMANLLRGIAALNGYDLPIDADKVLSFYADCVGNPPDLLNTDGAAALDVLKHIAATGFPLRFERACGLFGTVPLSRLALASALARVGPGYWGVALMAYDMTMPDVWDVDPKRNDGAIVGGHMVTAYDYTGLGDNDIVRIATWGRWQPATWTWIEARIEEAYAAVFRQLVKADGTFYAGVTADGLIREL